MRRNSTLLLAMLLVGFNGADPLGAQARVDDSPSIDRHHFAAVPDQDWPRWAPLQVEAHGNFSSSWHKPTPPGKTGRLHFSVSPTPPVQTRTSGRCVRWFMAGGGLLGGGLTLAENLKDDPEGVTTINEESPATAFVVGAVVGALTGWLVGSLAC